MTTYTLPGRFSRLYPNWRLSFSSKGGSRPPKREGKPVAGPIAGLFTGNSETLRTVPKRFGSLDSAFHSTPLEYVSHRLSTGRVAPGLRHCSICAVSGYSRFRLPGFSPIMLALERPGSSSLSNRFFDAGSSKCFCFSAGSLKAAASLGFILALRLE
jgi:hypothetical protein